MRITKTGIISDVHIPFECKAALALVLDAFEDVGIDRLVINGDLLDFINVSLHGPKHPDIITTLEDEVIAGREFLEGIRKRFPKIHIVFLFGNHCNRLDRFILQHSKPFWGLLRLEKMLNLEQLNIEHYPYNTAYQLEKSNLWVQHSPPSYGENGARTSLLKKVDRNYIYGCTHREQHASMTGASGAVYKAWFNGWLGSATASKEHREVFSYAKGHQNWQRTAGMAYISNEVDFFYNQISIEEVRPDECYRLLLEGAIYES